MVLLLLLSLQLLWKLNVIFVLCEAYTKLKRLGLESSDPIVLQVFFHSFFLQSIIGEPLVLGNNWAC